MDVTSNLKKISHSVWAHIIFLSIKCIFHYCLRISNVYCTWVTIVNLGLSRLTRHILTSYKRSIQKETYFCFFFEFWLLSQPSLLYSPFISLKCITLAYILHLIFYLHLNAAAAKHCLQPDTSKMHAYLTSRVSHNAWPALFIYLKEWAMIMEQPVLSY